MLFPGVSLVACRSSGAPIFNGVCHYRALSINLQKQTPRIMRCRGVCF
ncbi:hypothetical protein SAMN03159448_04558 [Sinorhizobium sp. NFACC03]|nr:hypothetical protein SAMN03159448_04558 [Sinorhizobium sp. NFACC03]